MAVSLQTSQARLLDQREKIKAVYEMLLDIPEEKLIFDRKKEEVGEGRLFSEPDQLRWVGLRIKQRIQEAAEKIQEAIERSEDGILDLSHKDLCDLTLRDFYAPLTGIWKINLSGNHLRSLPPLCQFQPYVHDLEAVGNCEPIDAIFQSYRSSNSVNIDLLETLKAVKETHFTHQSVYRSLFEDVAANPDKLTLTELAKRVHAFMLKTPIDADSLVIRPEIKEDERGERSVGGVKGYIPLRMFAALKHLDLSGCRLEYTPPSDWLIGMSDLETLKLNGATLRDVPSSLLSTKISRLELARTGVRALPDWFHRLTSLRHLDLSDCQISRLPTSFDSLRLDVLKIDHTLIESLDSVWSGIQHLSVKGTPILKVPHHLLPHLRDRMIIVDRSCSYALNMQQRIVSSFNSLVLSDLVYRAEVFKKSPGCAPEVIKAQLVGAEYFLFMALLGVWGTALMLSMPATMTCMQRRSYTSLSFQRYQQTQTSVGAKFLLYVMFHFLPAKNAWQDMRHLIRFLKN